MLNLNMKLNSLADDVFAASSKNDETVGRLSRNDIIATGRLCAAEYIGNNLNTLRNYKEGQGFVSKLKGIGGDYTTLARNHMEKKLMYCATKAYAVIGKPAPESIEQIKNDASLYRDPVFLRTMSEIDSEVISPLLYSVISDIAGPMMNLSSVPFGRTKEITVASNEAFLFEDSAWGSSRSTTKNYLYADTITLNPTPRTANATIKWMQLIAIDSGLEAGWYYTAIMQGLYSKIMALFTNALVSAASDTRYVPSYLSFASYSTANWGAATVAAAAANGISRDSLMAFGAYQALQAVLPSGTNSDAALTYNLGPEWMRNGFLAMVGRVPLFEVQQAIVPGTVNTTGTMIFPNDMIFIAGRMGPSLAPVHAAMTEGQPITIEMTPRETADFTLDINVTVGLDVKPVFASKIAVIDNVTL